ncbi:DNase I-like protein [Yamadazyma tenuis ATCC 10573]|uniref:DNase I-like protein n=2 Tax=Candida tenuis TaxID=2315449 RepID=G3AX04_CANTC|nr:DNase I-like protein [Yamadazyma tenuis ATCC 10573]EGV66653.1 DNase I-like protein [Yamadazyma tenuis ATCC 10573]
MEPNSIKLLTFNVWGLKYVSKFRKERIAGIVHKLRDPSEDYDVIALQEVWCEEDWQLIDHQLADLYPYRRRFKSGILTGPGLAILSKIPIKESWLYRFPVNGFPSAVHRGDWYVGKSLSVTTLAYNIVVLNSHMHAPYGYTGPNSYTCSRSCQAWDISKLINLLNKAGYHIILVGDLNSKPGSLPNKLFTQQTNLQDSWELFKSSSGQLLTNEEVSVLSPKDQILKGGVTCDSQLNSWRAKRRLDEACRLDYALINQSLGVVDASVKFVDSLPEVGCSYSDHFAYYVELKLGPKAEPQSSIDASKGDVWAVYKEFLAEIEVYKTQILPSHFKWREYHFYVSIVAILVLIVVNSMSFGPWTTVISVLLPIVSITGVINGMFALLWMRSELRNVGEVQLEVEDTLRALDTHDLIDLEVVGV